MQNIEIHRDEYGNKYLLSHEVAKLIDTRNKDVMKKIRAIYLKFNLQINRNNEEYYITYINHNNAYKNSRTYRMYKNDIKLYIDNSNKRTKLKPLIEIYNKEFSGSNEKVILSKRFEDEFMDKLEQSLQPLGYSLERQKAMFNGKYRIDGYIEELKLAIEYDEEQHNIYNNKILDKQRQQYIENELGCTFVRLDYKDTDAYNIGVVMEYIIHNKVA